MLESPIGKYFIMEVLAMKRQIVLRFESEKGKEEYCININRPIWMKIIEAIFESGGGKKAIRRNEIRKNIIFNSSDEDLIYEALNGITTYLTNAELDNLIKKYKNNENLQLLLLWYCWDNRRIPIIKKLQTEGATEKVREEANLFFKE